MLSRSIALNMVWGFGHFFVFASAAAVGAGLAVRVDHYARHSASAGLLTAGSVTVPTAVLVASIYAFHVSQHDRSPLVVGAFSAAAVMVLLGTFTPAPRGRGRPDVRSAGGSDRRPAPQGAAGS